MAKDIRDHIRAGLDQAEAEAAIAPALRQQLDAADRAEAMVRGVDARPISFIDPDPEIARAIFGSLGDFLQAVFRGTNQYGKATAGSTLDGWRDHNVRRGLHAYTGEGGGWNIPDVFLPELWNRTRSIDGPLARCRNYVGDAGKPGSHKAPVHVPTIDETTRQARGVAGFTLRLANDEADLSGFHDGDGSFGLATFTPQKMIIYGTVSDDLSMDAPMLGPALETLSTDAIRAALEDMMIRGNGVGEPQGVVGAPGTVAVTRTTGGTITTADVRAMVRALWTYSHRRGPVFHALPESLEVLGELADTHGNPILRMQGTAPDGNPYPPLLLNIPLLVHESAAPLGSPGDLILAEWGSYGLYTVGAKPRVPGAQAAPVMRMSIHHRFKEDLIAMKWVLHGHGFPMWKAPVTPPRKTSGTEKQSPFVCLT